MNTELQTDDTDSEIRDAYKRLGSALEGPVDVLARVERRIRIRRRRRIAGAGAAALVAVATAGLGFAFSGGDPTDAVVTDQPTDPVSTLTITRSDGSPYTFQDVTVSCSVDPGSGEQMIHAASPRRFEGNQALEPFVIFDARLDKVAEGRTFSLPAESPSGSSETRAMTLFFATNEGGPRANELSSAEPESSGTVEVVSASCGDTPRLTLIVDATLGSEVEQAPMQIAGELR